MKTALSVLCLASLAACLYAAPVPQTATAIPAKKLWAKSFLGKKAPDIVVAKWLSQQPDCKGKFVLIDFWATWCPPCRESIPELNAFSQKFKGKLVVIGISDEPESSVRSFKSPALNYYSAIDPNKRMYNTLGVTGIPHVIIIDPNGIVRWEGFPLLEHYQLTEQVIANILASKDNKLATNTNAGNALADVL